MFPFPLVCRLISMIVTPFLLTQCFNMTKFLPYEYMKIKAEKVPSPPISRVLKSPERQFHGQIACTRIFLRRTLGFLLGCLDSRSFLIFLDGVTYVLVGDDDVGEGGLQRFLDVAGLCPKLIQLINV